MNSGGGTVTYKGSGASELCRASHLSGICLTIVSFGNLCCKNARREQLEGKMVATLFKTRLSANKPRTIQPRGDMCLAANPTLSSRLLPTAFQCCRTTIKESTLPFVSFKRDVMGDLVSRSLRGSRLVPLKGLISSNLITFLYTRNIKHVVSNYPVLRYLAL